MVQVQTWLKTRDNSGARSVECIKTLGGYNRSISFSGDFILVSVKRLRLVRKVKVGLIYCALITRTRKQTNFKDGSYSGWELNVVLVRSRKHRVLGTRFFGMVSRKLRVKIHVRILLLCSRKTILVFLY